MHCTHVKLPGGVNVIECGSWPHPKHCTACDKVARYLCDWKVDGGKTCDLPICAIHAEPVAEDKHLCPKHSKAWAQWKAQRVPDTLPLEGEPK